MFIALLQCWSSENTQNISYQKAMKYRKTSSKGKSRFLPKREKEELISYSIHLQMHKNTIYKTMLMYILPVKYKMHASFILILRNVAVSILYFAGNISIYKHYFLIRMFFLIQLHM